MRSQPGPCSLFQFFIQVNDPQAPGAIDPVQEANGKPQNPKPQNPKTQNPKNPNSTQLLYRILSQVLLQRLDAHLNSLFFIKASSNEPTVVYKRCGLEARHCLKL